MVDITKTHQKVANSYDLLVGIHAMAEIILINLAWFVLMTAVAYLIESLKGPGTLPSFVIVAGVMVICNFLLLRKHWVKVTGIK